METSTLQGYLAEAQKYAEADAERKVEEMQRVQDHPRQPLSFWQMAMAVFVGNLMLVILFAVLYVLLRNSGSGY